MKENRYDATRREAVRLDAERTRSNSDERNGSLAIKWWKITRPRIFHREGRLDFTGLIDRFDFQAPWQIPRLYFPGTLTGIARYTERIRNGSDVYTRARSGHVIASIYNIWSLAFVVELKDRKTKPFSFLCRSMERNLENLEDLRELSSTSKPRKLLVCRVKTKRKK